MPASAAVPSPYTIRVGAEKVKAVSVDYEKNRLTVDREISWEAGAPVGLDYAGKGPDIGCCESGMPQP